MALNVMVDEALCAGHGRCAVTAPDIFELDDEGYCTLAGKGPVVFRDEQADDARDAERVCPEGAVRVTED